MKKSLTALSLALLLSSCGGGYDDMDDARLGSGIGSTVTKPDVPAKPSDKTRWQYSSYENSSGIFALRANNYSLNYFYDPKFTNIKHTPWVELEKRKSSSGAVTGTVTIFVNSTLACTPSCKVSMTFNGQRASYEMQNSIDGVIKPINDFTEKQLFNKFATSNRATISLPVIGLSQPFDAEYDLRDYDVNRMTF